MDSIWFEITVFILAIFLAIFLIASIILLIKIIDLVKQIKKIVDQAEKVADRAEQISSFFEKTATPVAIMKLVSNFSDMFSNKSKRKRRQND